MAGGGPSVSGSATSTTKTSPWGPAAPYGQLFLAEMANTLFPGAFKTPAIPGLGIGKGGTLPSLPSMPAGLNQQVAPFTAGQESALSGVNAITPTAMDLTGLGAGTMANFASGANLYPGSNPMLQAYYNAAAGPMVQNYQDAVMPGLMAQGEQTGSVGGTGYQTGIGQAQYNLGQGLSTLGANIFEPAYQQGQQLQFGAAQGMPASAMSLYGPLAAQFGAGAAQQQQQQNVLNTNYQNALAQTQWPFALLSELGGAFGSTAGAGGTSFGTQPIIGGGGMGTKL